MTTNGTDKLLGNAIGVMMGLLTLGLLVYTVGVKLHLWESSPAGFWTF
jgi:hypothetical protein